MLGRTWQVYLVEVYAAPWTVANKDICAVTSRTDSIGTQSAMHSGRLLKTGQHDKSQLGMCCRALVRGTGRDPHAARRPDVLPAAAALHAPGHPAPAAVVPLGHAPVIPPCQHRPIACCGMLSHTLASCLRNSAEALTGLASMTTPRHRCGLGRGRRQLRGERWPHRRRHRQGAAVAPGRGPTVRWLP
jgi:hypothetical protein